MPFDSSELSKFSDSGRAIAKAAGVGIEQWVNGEAADILKGWANRVPVMSEEKTKPRSRLRLAKSVGATRANEPGKSTINTGVRVKKLGHGNVWIRTKNGWRLISFISDSGSQSDKRVHLKDSDWARVSSQMSAFSGAIARTIELGKRSVGLAKQSVIQIADSLGMSFGGAEEGRARSAVASDGKTYVNGYGTKGNDQGGYFVELVNTYPAAQKAKLDIRLQAVISQRVALFEQNAAKGVFNSIEKTAAAYPYLQVIK